MDDETLDTMDDPDRLIRSIVEIIDELEDAGIIDADRASDLRSDVYRSDDVEFDEDDPRLE